MASDESTQQYHTRFRNRAQILVMNPSNSLLTLLLIFEDVRSLRVNIDRALIFGYDLHEHFMQLILKFGQYLQHSLFIT